MESLKFSGRIRLRTELREDGFFVVTSPDLPGLLLCGDDVDVLIEQAQEVIGGLFKLNHGMDVDVVRPTKIP